MSKTTENDVLQALAAVTLPNGGGNIIEAGLLCALSIKPEEGGAHVQIALEIAPTEIEAMEPVRLAAEKALQALPDVTRVTAVLTAHKAAPAPKAHPPHGKAMESKLPEGVKHVIAVASGKGGVGKSTMAINLALAFAQQGLKVGLLDADVYGPSIPRLVGRMPDIEQTEEGQLIPVLAYGVSLMSIGFLVPEDAPIIWRGPMVHGALRQMFYDVAWGALDLLILDMPPGTGDVALSVAQQVPLSGAIIVSTPQDIALLDVRKGIAMFQKIGVPILGMIENMSGFECPHCHETIEIFGCGGAKEEAARLGIPFLGRVPLDLALRETSDAGTPAMTLEPTVPQAQAFLAMASRLKEKL